MKLKLSILSLSVLAVLTTACEPRDQKITRPDTRVNGQQGGGTFQADGKQDNYRYIAMLAERQVEAIELFRAITDAEYATAKNVVTKDIEIDGMKFKKVSLKSVLKNDRYETTRDLVLAVKLTTDEQGQLQAISAQEIKSQLSFEKVLKVDTKTDVSIKNKEKRILIQAAADQSWNVAIQQQDEINVKSGKTLMTNAVRFNFVAVNGNAEVFKIQNVQMNHSRYGVQYGDFNMQSDESTMTVEVSTAQQCTSISGVLHLNSIEMKNDKPLYDRTLTYNQSAIDIKAGHLTIPVPAAACEERLSVDLRKVL